MSSPIAEPAPMNESPEMLVLRRMIARIRRSARLHLLIELVLLLALALTAPEIIHDSSPDRRIRGSEFTYLIGTGEIARVTLNAVGGIPLWNSWIGLGEPLLESGFSYVLNPLMFFPVLAGGLAQGAKAAVILHAGLMALGGWALGYSLGLGRVGRVFLGLMLCSTGGLVGAIGMGFYQMALSQAYVPFVYAAVIGCLRRSERVWVGLLAVSGALLIFSGTFWYVLPTAIGSALLVLFGVIGLQRQRPFVTINVQAVRRLSLGVGLLIAIAMIRLLPVLVNFRLWWHTPEGFTVSYTFSETVARFFNPVTPFPEPSSLYFFYAAPLALVLTVLILRLLAQFTWQPFRREQWQIIVPAALALFLLISWAQIDTPFFRHLYQWIPFLNEWRLLTRMSAAAAVWLLLLLAIGLSDLIAVFRRLRRSESLSLLARRMATVALISLIAFAALSTWDVRHNWWRESGVEPLVPFNRTRLFIERQARPEAFIQMDTYDFFDYTWFYVTLIRASEGNPDYYPYSLPHTISNQQTMRWFTPEAIEFHREFVAVLQRSGYELAPEDVDLVNEVRIWRHPQSPPYAFTVAEQRIPVNRVDSLSINEVASADYFYQLDTITLWTLPQPTDSVAVVTETAYPGWQVSVNGEPRPLESVGGLLGVRLPAGEAATIVFTYRPPAVYVGGVITLIGCLVTALWLLRVDRLVKRLVSA